MVKENCAKCTHLLHQPNMGNQNNPVYSRHSSFTLCDLDIKLRTQFYVPYICLSFFLASLAFLVFKLQMCYDMKDQKRKSQKKGSQSGETKVRKPTYLYSFDYRRRVEVAQDTHSGVRHSH